MSVSERVESWVARHGDEGGLKWPFSKTDPQLVQSGVVDGFPSLKLDVPYRWKCGEGKIKRLEVAIRFALWSFSSVYSWGKCSHSDYWSFRDEAAVEFGLVPTDPDWCAVKLVHDGRLVPVSNRVTWLRVKEAESRLKEKMTCRR